MNLPVKVNVVWAEQKIAHLPTGSSYATAAKFAEDADTWPSEAWSVVLDFPLGAAQARSFEATARFLMPNAPSARLRTGCVFELVEGAKLAAIITVL